MSEAGLRVAVVGCGLIGQRRARALTGAKLVACADIDAKKAQSLADPMGCVAFDNWRTMLDRAPCDIVIVATLHNSLAEITLECVRHGRHVLVEKPAARRRSELEPVLAAAAQTGVQVRVGFNHRYHRALRKARELVDAGAVGQLLFIRGQYGHGGRPGYDREWRADPKLSGGGELIDQGPHLIDLARWFLGDFAEVHGFADTLFWDMPVDDNGFYAAADCGSQDALLHVSCTEWKNTFSFQIYGKTGKIEITDLAVATASSALPLPNAAGDGTSGDDDLGISHGATIPGTVEFAEFVDDIRLMRTPAAGLREQWPCLASSNGFMRFPGYDHRS